MAKAGSPPHDFFLTIPEPRETSFTGGVADLSEDVRLVTSNVAPLYRKTMRTVLAAAGIRVVANKKKFIIDVRVEKPEVLTLKDVSAVAREEYYEIEVLDNAVTIRTATQIGALWGSHTLAGIYRARTRGVPIPNMKLRDWADYTCRAAYLKSLWGVDRMAPEEWMGFFERLAGAKLNAVGIPMDGGRNHGCPETFSEGVLIPFPEHEACHKEVHLTWFSPGLKSWRHETHFPRFHQENVLAQTLGMARENGLKPFPLVSGLGERTALPRLLPKMSALGTDGRPTGAAYCLSSPETRKELEAFYAAVLSAFTALDPVPFFMIHLGTPPAAAPAAKGQTAGAWCECPKCRKKGAAQLIQEHLSWLCEFLVRNKVSQVLICDEQSAALRQAVFSADFARQLARAKLAGAVTLVRREGAAERKKSAALGWRLLATPEIAPATWMDVATFTKNVSSVLTEGFKTGLTGAILEVLWDSPCLGPLETFATFAWRAQQPPRIRSATEIVSLHMTKETDKFCEAYACIEKLGIPGSVLAPLLNAPAFVRVMPSVAPGVFDLAPALGAFAADGGKPFRAELAAVAAAARKAAALQNALLDREEKPENLDMIRTLSCETARLGTLAQFVDAMIGIWEAVARKKVDAKTVKACEALRAVLLEGLAAIESRRTKLTGPLKQADFTPMLGLVEQLQGDLRDAAAGKKKPADVRWRWTQPPPPVV